MIVTVRISVVIKISFLFILPAKTLMKTKEPKPDTTTNFRQTKYVHERLRSGCQNKSMFY